MLEKENNVIEHEAKARDQVFDQEQERRRNTRK